MKTQHEIFLISFIDVVAISVAIVIAADVATHGDAVDVAVADDDDVVHFVANWSGGGHC